MIFVEEWPKEKTFIIQLNQNFGIEFTENHLKKSSKFRKTVLFVHESKYNVFWSDGRTNMWRKPGEEILKEMFIQRLNILVVTWCVVMRGSIRSGKSSYYQRHHEQTRLCKPVAYQEGGFGVFTTPLPPKFWRYRWSPRSHKQEEPASRFPFAVHCVLVRL